MKVLITGAAGQVGQALVAGAPAEIELIATTREQLDICDAAMTSAAIEQSRPDLVINAAAYTAVDQAETAVEQARRVNEIGPRNLATACRQFGARLVHLSTDFVFDGTQSKPYRTNDTPAPLGVYGATKLGGENAVRDSLPGSSVVLRTAWVYAPRGRNFLLTMLRLMREHGTVRVVSDQLGSPTAAASIATALWAIAKTPVLHGIYHWTDDGVASWYDFAVAIGEQATEFGLLAERPTVVPIPTSEYPTPARRPAYSVLDSSTTVDAIGIQPPRWRDSLRRVLAEV